MAGVKKGKRTKRDDKDADEDLRADDDAEALAARDDSMARLAGALASLRVAEQSVVEALSLFVNPGEDEDGDAREELIDEAIEAAGAATRGLEAAAEALKEADTAAGEPWEEDDEE